MRVWTFLVCQGLVRCRSVFEGDQGDWIIPEGPCCTDQNGDCIFPNCCDFRFMLRHLWRVIRHGGSLQPGHGGCLDQRPEECCSVNRNVAQRYLPWYNHGLLTIKARSRRSQRDHYLKVLQGSALNWWSQRFLDVAKPRYGRSFPTFDAWPVELNERDISVLSGAGLLWPAGYALGQVISQVHVEPLTQVRFLDVAAGTGLASLVGLLRGWHVLSTDLVAESGKARLLSAMATFGRNSSLVDEHLQIAEMDMFDVSSWPNSTTAPALYHVIGGSTVSNVLGEQRKFQRAFRKLVASNLAPGGVGLYTFVMALKDAEEYIGELLPEFLGTTDLTKVLLYQRRNAHWFPIQMHDARPEAVHVAVFQREGSSFEVFGG